MMVTRAMFPNQYANAITRHEQKKKYCPMQHLLEINENKQKTEKLLSYPILCPLCHIHQRKQIKTKFIQLSIYFNLVGQVHIVKKGFYKTWTFDRSSPQCSGEMVYQTMHCLKKKTKAWRQKLVECIMKNSNVRESPIARDTLLIKDAESRVKRRVPKLLLECSMQQFHNEIIASPDDGCLLGARHADKNYVIISDTMLRYLAPPQLCPMKYHHKIMCGCAICNTSKYFQEWLNA